MAKIRYFNGDIELKNAHCVSNEEFLAMGGIMSKHNFYSHQTRFVGHTMSGIDKVLPVTRKVILKSNPSKHKCNAKCINATGHQCECECGGVNHGRGNG